jgi:hypothetical protein
MIPTLDLDVMYQHFTVPATVGAVTAPVHFRQPDVDVLGERIARDYTMRFRSSDFASLVRGNTVTISAVAYKVLEVRQLDNGVEAIARLGKT